MSRPLRIEFPGALYHITSRGDRRESIYDNDGDRLAFLSLLNDVCDTYNWVCHAYCLMSNHYHLLIETPDANLCRGMRQLNGVYTQTFNALHQRVGHVFQGRYKAILVDKETYLLELSRYIVLNPVRAGMVASAEDWPWSSYCSTVGLEKAIDCLNKDWLLAVFSNNTSEAILQYVQFVEEGMGQETPWKHLRNQIYMGSESFVERIQKLVDDKKDLSEVPSAQKTINPIVSWSL